MRARVLVLLLGASRGLLVPRRPSALRPSSRDNICRIPSTGRCMAGRRTGIDAAGNARIISPHSATTTALPSMPPKAAVRVPDAGPGGVDFVIGGWSAVVPYPGTW